MREHRGAFELRPLEIEPGINAYAEGSCLVTWGNTKVYVTATVEEKVPPFLRGQGRGWVTAEYAMLPRATHSRNQRESVKGKQSGRSQEISRLIGRSLRAAVDFEALGERQILIDCDVLQADGGTRCASITGGYVALALAMKKLQGAGLVRGDVLTRQVAALSVGVVGGELVADLDYEEDSNADADLNLVGDDQGGLIELQGTGERATFSVEQLTDLLNSVKPLFYQIFEAQKRALNRQLPLEIVIATGNRHKYEEFCALLEPRGVKVLLGKELQPDLEPEETGSTFAQNARIKAQAWARACKKPALADDSGIAVVALGGKPGIFSARWGSDDADCRARLLQQMEGIQDRRAAFVSALCLCDADGQVLFETEGVCPGQVLESEQGDGGFGYDSLFLADGQALSFAAMASEEKNRISHRALALQNLVEHYSLTK